ncbi:MAG: hypothetical protein AUH29_11905 [Candidatus Rokubacteria bacterium 13_1_40CM_69_27]|nr:MAG: hypothetical protein AUH29_11905 [Candidatus Rokubacteria bacterium 13_1_40CM_69_27]
MLYLPSSRIRELLKVEQAGVWLDRSSNTKELWMVAKLPMNVIRAINAGALVLLGSWVVEIDGKRVAAFGFRVDDNPQHPTLYFGACRSTEQVEDLRALLTTTWFPLQVHNETFLPVLHADCRIVPERARPVLDLLPPVGDSPATEQRELRVRALDVIAASVEPDAVPDARLRASCLQPLVFERTQSLKSYVPGTGLVCLDDKDEGNELERLGFQAFDHLCPFGAFHQPLVESGGKRRELCDILAVSRIREQEDEGIFVVQSKVTSATPESLGRTDARRAASIQKNILCAVGQLNGAIRRLRAGDRIFRADGTSVEVDPPVPDLKGAVEPLNIRERASKVGHGIVLVSDMHEGVDWKAVARELIHVGKAAGYLCHVLDLRELQRLVSHSAGRPAMLERYLTQRWQLMVQPKSALVRSQFLR